MGESAQVPRVPSVSDCQLNALGADGWELVSTDALVGEPGFGLPRTTRIALWFKRRLA